MQKDDVTPFQLLLAARRYASGEITIKGVEEAVGPEWGRVVTALVAPRTTATETMPMRLRVGRTGADTVVDATVVSATRASITIPASILRVLTHEELLCVLGDAR